MWRGHHSGPGHGARALLRYAAMTRPRRARLGALVLLAATVVACGSSRNRVATGPEPTLGPPTTPTATASPPATPSPSATPAPTPTPAATPTPLSTSSGIIPAGDPDGAAKLGAYLYPSSAGVACGGRTGHYDSCPVTGRLASRLDSHPTDGAEPLCRCQNSWRSSSVNAAQTSDPTIWVDHVVLTFGPGVTVAIDVSVLRTAGGWLADDTTCTGGGSPTSIYAQSPPPCPGT